MSIFTIMPHGGALEEGLMQKAKDMAQRRIRFPEDLCRVIEKNGGRESRQFNTEVIYQLKKAYGMLEKAVHEAQ